MRLSRWELGAFRQALAWPAAHAPGKQPVRTMIHCMEAPDEPPSAQELCHPALASSSGIGLATLAAFPQMLSPSSAAALTASPGISSQHWHTVQERRAAAGWACRRWHSSGAAWAWAPPATQTPCTRLCRGGLESSTPSRSPAPSRSASPGQSRTISRVGCVPPVTATWLADVRPVYADRSERHVQLPARLCLSSMSSLPFSLR